MEDGGWGWMLMAVAGPVILGIALLYGTTRWRQRHRRHDTMQLGEPGDHVGPRANLRDD
jgi:membrane-anchored protein YejM (alkaline phosphatase superfamily)